MQEKNEEAIKILEKLEVELAFLRNMMICVGITDFELNSDNMLGLSSFISRIEKDVQKSMDILS